MSKNCDMQMSLIVPVAMPTHGSTGTHGRAFECSYMKTEKGDEQISQLVPHNVAPIHRSTRGSHAVCCLLLALYF